MSNSDDETQSELSSENDTEIIRMLDSEKIKMVMREFKYCIEEIEIKHSIGHKEEVEKLYKIFLKFVEDSLKFSNHLLNYSLKVRYFTKRFNDKNHSDKEISVLLDGLLKDSKKNHISAKELEKRLFNDNEDGGIIKKLLDSIFGGGIMNELKKIEKSLQDSKNEIASDENALTTYKEAVRKAEKWLEEKKQKINTQLNNRRKELDMINLFGKSLETISSGIGNIKTFWGTQIVYIEEIIENLGDFKEGEDIQRDRIVYLLKHKWRNVKNECRSYYKEMNEICINERL
ncbi:hypothetical protein RclHR1_08080008 [Rhizophagus clarus]|uniref:Uncharacterized protein n=1 Tax=Rhizophagus clarus TaxID=94130 RepID=A0A2Z6RZN6_9GLOM|nr:hypothetical protein RclHR1_08080008 [Rhizophagus clarus]